MPRVVYQPSEFSSLDVRVIDKSEQSSVIQNEDNEDDSASTFVKLDVPSESGGQSTVTGNLGCFQRF